MVTYVPTGPLVGANELIVGVAVNAAELVAVPLGVITEIGPVVAESGTIAWISDSETTVKVVWPLLVNWTNAAPVKLEPRMSTLVPAGLLVGVNELIVGGGGSTVNTVE